VGSESSSSASLVPRSLPSKAALSYLVLAWNLGHTRPTMVDGTPRALAFVLPIHGSTAAHVPSLHVMHLNRIVDTTILSASLAALTHCATGAISAILRSILWRESRKRFWKPDITTTNFSPSFPLPEGSSATVTGSRRSRRLTRSVLSRDPRTGTLMMPGLVRN